MTKQLIAAAFAGCLAWGASSAVAKADPLYVEVQTAPRHYETYPHTTYEGRPAYYVDGRWYYREGPRWRYYREEPRPLVEFRSSPGYHHHDRAYHDHGHHHHHR